MLNSTLRRDFHCVTNKTVSQSLEQAKSSLLTGGNLEQDQAQVCGLTCSPSRGQRGQEEETHSLRIYSVLERKWF